MLPRYEGSEIGYISFPPCALGSGSHPSVHHVSNLKPLLSHKHGRIWMQMGKALDGWAHTGWLRQTRLHWFAWRMECLASVWPSCYQHYFALDTDTIFFASPVERKCSVYAAVLLIYFFAALRQVVSIYSTEFQTTFSEFLCSILEHRCVLAEGSIGREIFIYQRRFCGGTSPLHVVCSKLVDDNHGYDVWREMCDYDYERSRTVSVSDIVFTMSRGERGCMLLCFSGQTWQQMAGA